MATVTDPYIGWLESVTTNGGAPPDSDVASELMRTSLVLAQAARDRGDHINGRYHALVSGQAYIAVILARVGKQLDRIEKACPGLNEEEK